MKYIKRIALPLLLTLFGGLVLSSCSVDEPTVVTPKSYDQYLQQSIQFYSSERQMVDSCKVGYNKGDFTPVSTSSFTKYRLLYLAVLRKDSAVIYSKNATIAQLVAAYTQLNASKDSIKLPGDTKFTMLISAGKNFWGKINISDRRPLNDLITTATQLNTNTLVGTSAGCVLQNDKNVFTAAIASATATRDASTTIDRQVKTGVDLLTAAMSAFQAAVIPADIATFINNSSSYISAQLTIVNSSVAGYDINQYIPTLRTNYLTALQTAQSTVVTGATYDQVSTALNNLVAPRTAFVPNISDRRTLNDSIGIAETLNTATVVGTASGQVPQTAKNTFTSAITNAKTARDNPLTVDGTVKSATYSLTLAKQKFVTAIIK